MSGTRWNGAGAPPPGGASPNTWSVLSSSGRLPKSARRAETAVAGTPPGAKAWPVSTTPALGKKGARSLARRRLSAVSFSRKRSSRSSAAGSTRVASASWWSAKDAFTSTVTRSTPPCRQSTVPVETGLSATTSSGVVEGIGAESIAPWRPGRSRGGRHHPAHRIGAPASSRLGSRPWPHGRS